MLELKRTNGGSSLALTLDLPSPSIKCSTYVTSPTTNQIPDDTHQGERSRENNWGLEQTQTGER